MKNLLSLMFVAAAAMTFTACSDADDIMPNNESRNSLTVIASNPEMEDDTRTSVIQGQPHWSEGDYIYMINWNKTTGFNNNYAQFFKSNQLVVGEDAFTAQFTFTNLKDVNANDHIQFVYAKNIAKTNSTQYIGDISEVGNKSLNAVIPTEMTPLTLFDFSDGDILFSQDDIKYPETGDLKVRFKRFTSAVRMIINQETLDLVPIEDPIASVELSDYGFDLAGDVDYGLSSKQFTCYDYQKRLSINLSNFDYNFNFQQGFVFSCAPVDKEKVSELSYKKNDKITFTIWTKKGRKFVKTVTDLNAKNFELRPGTLNTIKLTISKDDEVDVTLPEYTPGSGEITINVPGYLTKDVINKAVGEGDILKINGDLKVNDFMVIRDFLEYCQKNYRLDLSDANILKDDTEFIDSWNEKWTDNCLVQNFIESKHKISELILPNSLTTINNSAINMNVGTTLVVGPNVTNIAAGAIGCSDQLKTNNFTVIINAPFTSGKTDVKESAISCTIGGALKLHHSWRDSGEGFYKHDQWYIYWKGSGIRDNKGNMSAYYIEEDGTETLVTIDDKDLPVK